MIKKTLLALASLFCCIAVSAQDTTDNLTFKVGDVSFKMIYVEGGTFMMGATPEQGDDTWLSELPTHKVTLKPYYIGQLEVTQDLYKAVMGKNPSRNEGDKLPVESVSWEESQLFVDELNELLRRELGRRYFALPSEAQWEYAARGGKDSEQYKYSGDDDPAAVSWHSENSQDHTHSVGMLKANELGIFDMSGNVAEWCADWWSVYNTEHRRNPEVITEGVEHSHIVRGGGFDRNSRFCRVSTRQKLQPEKSSESIGIRLVLIP